MALCQRRAVPFTTRARIRNMPTIAYRAVRSRRVFVNAPKVRKYLEAGIDSEVKPHMLKQFRRVVSNWKHKVEFKSRKFITADSIKLNIFAAGPHKKIWTFVVGGTKRHKIPKVARPGKRLAFMWGGPGSYVPKTSPPAKFGGPGIVRGGTLRRPKQVDHPGTKPRPFPKEIRKEETPWFRRTMENMWRRAIRRL